MQDSERHADPSPHRARRRTPGVGLRVLLAAGLAGSIVVAACGSSPASPVAATPAPTGLTPAPTASPSEAATASPAPTASPSEAATPTEAALPSPGTFAFAASAVVDYYIGEGYTCGEAAPSLQAVDFEIRRCQLEAGDLTIIIGIVSDTDDAIGNGFMGVLGSDGVTTPSPRDAFEPMAGFLGAMLGPDAGTTTMSWLAEHLGEESAETQANGLVAATYAATDDAGPGLYVELASPAFMEAPVPAQG